MNTMALQSCAIKRKALLQIIWDFIGIVCRLALLPPKYVKMFGWTTMEEERLRMALPYIKGKLLDIGAGENNLVKMHGDGVGVDIHEWGGGAMVVEDSANLPLEDNSFDTSCFYCLH